MPQSPDPFLLSLLNQYCVVSKQGKKREGRVHLVGKICSAITEYWEDGEDIRTSASENGWPLNIDFEKIPQRIINLEKRIVGVIDNYFILKDRQAWKSFLTLLKGANCNMGDFHGMQEWGKFRAVGTNAHAG